MGHWLRRFAACVAAGKLRRAEAERIASPFKSHVQGQLANLRLPCAEEFGGDFPEVDALLERAGILA